MTLQEIIAAAISTAVSGTDPNTNIIQKLTMEAEPILDQCIHQLAEMVRGDARLRARMAKEFSVTLTNGVGAVPATLLIQHIGEGIVRDGDAGANDGFGNILERKHHEADFRGFLVPAYGYYLIKGDTSGVSQIYTRQIATGSFVDTVSPLTITAPYTPTKANLNTAVDSEISDELVQMLAIRLRGFIPGMQPAA